MAQTMKLYQRAQTVRIVPNGTKQQQKKRTMPNSTRWETVPNGTKYETAPDGTQKENYAKRHRMGNYTEWYKMETRPNGAKMYQSKLNSGKKG